MSDLFRYSPDHVIFRFANVDLAVVSAMSPWLSLPRLVMSYDIACQYIINFMKRMRGALSTMDDLDHIAREDIERLMKIELVPSVPKFHAPAHKRECRYNFSLDYLEGSGRTDGEAVERTWSEQNGLALRTREMAEGHRHDTISDYHGQGNDRRCITLGMHCSFCDERETYVCPVASLLQRRRKDAQRILVDVQAHLDALEDDLRSQPSIGPAVLAAWRAEEKNWMAEILDRTKWDKLRNPYHLSDEHRKPCPSCVALELIPSQGQWRRMCKMR